MSIAERLAKYGTACQESLEDLWNRLCGHKAWVRRILKDAKFAETVRAAEIADEVIVVDEQLKVLEENL